MISQRVDCVCPAVYLRVGPSPLPPSPARTHQGHPPRLVFSQQELWGGGGRRLGRNQGFPFMWFYLGWPLLHIPVPLGQASVGPTPGPQDPFVSSPQVGLYFPLLLICIICSFPQHPCLAAQIFHHLYGITNSLCPVWTMCKQNKLWVPI